MQSRNVPRRDDLVDDGGADCSADEEGASECDGTGGSGSGGGGSAGDGTAGGDGGGGGAFAWSEEEFMDWIVGTVNQDFAMNMAYFSSRLLDQPMQACSAVVQQCRETCTTMGALETAGCAALGTAASVLLTPTIGGSAAFYCAGRVFVATEMCKAGCNTPAVPCSR